MIKVFGERGSGKTTKLIELAHENGYILVEPTHQMAKCASMVANDLGYDDVKIIDGYSFWHRPQLREEKFLIDELDLFLTTLGVDGYSVNEEAESNA